MPKYDYVALDSRGKETKGTVEVASQNEAIGRVKEMGLFPTKIVEIEKGQVKKVIFQEKPGPPPGLAAKKVASTSTSTSTSRGWAEGSNRRF